MVIIAGAGLAGLLAAKMLRGNNLVIEQYPELPNNHSALLRFRTDLVSRATNIPFRKVSVFKGVADYNEIRPYASISDMNAYSFRVTGKVSERSIGNLTPGERWIAPDNFIELLADSANIDFDHPLRYDNIISPQKDAPGGKGSIISTIPMPALMHILKYSPQPDFQYRTVWNITCELNNCDVYQTLYFPHEYTMPYRASVTGNRLIMEFERQPPEDQTYHLINTVLRWMSIPDSYHNVSLHQQQYGKIAPIGDTERKAFIMWATDNFNIYSLGRYATWRPGLLLDDVVQDVNIIQQMISYRNEYSRRKHYATKD